MKCEDCGGRLSGTPGEYTALRHGLALCQACQESMNAEREAYAQIMADEGCACIFDAERGRFVTVPIEQIVEV